MKFRDKNGRVYSVDDEMVQRAAQALNGIRPLGEENNSARRILKAALTTPAEPEIEVTDEMVIAAYKIRNRIIRGIGLTEPPSLYISNKDLADLYRTMFTARPKETVKVASGVFTDDIWVDADRVRYSPPKEIPACEHGAINQFHRRKDDP